MKIDRNRLWYFILHIGVLIAILLFPLYRHFTDFLSQYTVGCPLHDRLFLYCPFCGGTRAAEAILQLRFADAIRDNALAVCLLASVIALDIVSFVRLIRKQNPFFPLPVWVWITLGIVIVAFGVLRNVCLICFLYDPLGDLLPFWTLVRGGAF